MRRFENQNIIVTGGTRGIGRGITESFLKEGARVFATYTRNESAAQQFKEENSQYAEKLILKKFDVSQGQDCERAFQEIEQEAEEIHVLVNNSGIRSDSLLATMSEESWDKVLDINLKGTFLMSRLAVMHFLKNRYGRIINMSSIGGKLGLNGQANYAASKAGQIALTQSLSKEVAKKKITVNCVAPGFIETELISDLPTEQISEYKKSVPMKRFGQVHEVASAVLFLASKEASYITGSTLEVTGGL